MENQYVFYEWKALRCKVEKLTGESKKSNLISVEYMIVLTLLPESNSLT